MWIFQGLHEDLEVVLTQSDGGRPSALLEYSAEKKHLALLLSFQPSASEVQFDSSR